MEKHKCKLCFRSFANGRALGGHMRSHMMNLPVVPPKPNELSPVQLNPEFSFAPDTASVILQDRESETDSSKNPTRKRSKRPWQLAETVKNIKFTESASSASDTTTEEDVAFCLMMLSRDNWDENKHKTKHRELEHDEVEYEDEEEEEEEEEEEDDEDGYESEEVKVSKKSNKAKGRYKCETCDKVFRSYQALGGHRASHKKIKLNDETENQTELESEHVVEKKTHECPVCFRVFASGQALGGHKRTHVIGSSATTTASTTPAIVRTVSVRTSSSAKAGDSLLDLNLPAPVDEDDSHFDDSAVSDAEFVKL
uniref:Zinc finger protein 1 n=1 Tax=Cajanus cajan TaxID=3821 RepID=A0A151RHU5_CAJCA|nr:Zinc finger protein 1 [Cajanus cajan]